MQAMERFERAKRRASAPRAVCRTWTSRASMCKSSILPRRTDAGPGVSDTKLLAACCRAYNDWATIIARRTRSGCDGPRSCRCRMWKKPIKEANRAAKNGAVSFYIRPNPVAGRNLLHRDYLPLFTEIEQLGKPISTHESGSAVGIPSFGDRMEYPCQRAHPVPSVRSDGRDGRAYLVRHLRKFPAS